MHGEADWGSLGLELWTASGFVQRQQSLIVIAPI